jgi:hypothetical protein
MRIVFATHRCSVWSGLTPSCAYLLISLTGLLLGACQAGSRVGAIALDAEGIEVHDSPAEGGVPTDEDAIGADDAAMCGTPLPVETIPGTGSCSTTITRCGTSPDSCLGAELRTVLSSRLAACGIYCGDLFVGFSGGCATSIRWIVAGAVNGIAETTAKLCLEKTLFASRFDCAPGEGWQRLFLGSCTVP